MKIREFMKSGHPKTLFCAFLYFDMSFMVWVLMGALGVYIAQDLHLNDAQKGLMVATPLLGGSLLRIPMGLLVDRMGGRFTGLLGMALTLVPLALLWQRSAAMGQITQAALMLGIAGASFAVALPMASRWYPPEQQGLVMGIAGAGNSGTVIAALCAPLLAQQMGWRNVFGLAMLPIVLTMVLFAALVKDAPNQPKPKSAKEYLTVCKRGDMYLFCLFYSLTFGGFVGLASFLSIFFHDQYGLAKTTAGQFTALCVFAGSFVRPIGGYLADRFGGIRMLGILYVTIAALMFAVSTSPSIYMVTGLLFLTMAVLGMGNGSVFQLVPQRFRKEVGIITGVVGTAGGLGGFFLPSLLGAIKGRTGSFSLGFFAFGTLALLCAGTVALVRSSWRRPVAEETAGMVAQVR